MRQLHLTSSPQSFSVPRHRSLTLPLLPSKSRLLLLGENDLEPVPLASSWEPRTLPQLRNEATMACGLIDSCQPAVTHGPGLTLPGILMPKKMKGDLFFPKLIETQKGWGFHELGHSTFGHIYSSIRTSMFG